MCGIFCIASEKSDVPERVLEGLKVLEYRGYDSWGVAYLKDKSLTVKKEVGKIGQARISAKGRLGIGHTRWATHGGVTVANAHPHLSCDGKIAIVHNGIIDNYLDLKEDLPKKHKFVSQTDSEVIAHLLEQGEFLPVLRKLKGLNAVIALDAKSNSIWGAKTGSPLVVGFGKHENYLASDAAALLPYTHQVHFLEDGQAVSISAKKVEIFEVATGRKLTVVPQKLTWDVQEAQLFGFDHFLIKEINEQPAVMRALVATSSDDIERLARLITRAYGTFFVACGTAQHAAQAGVYLFSKLAKRHVNLASGGEFTYLADFVTRGSLVVGLSQSGETIDVVESIQAAKNRGATIVAIVNVVGSTLYRMSEARVPLKAGPEKSVLATKSYIAKLSVLFLTAYALSNRLVTARSLLLKTAKAIETFLHDKRHLQIKKLADNLQSVEHIFLLGRGQSHTDALEGALKIKEVSYIHAEGFAGGDLKHGSIALIEEGTPVIVFAPLDETYDAIISNAMEVKARGAFIVGVSPKSHEVFDEHIKVADVGSASNFVNIVPMQLLAYYLALVRGCDPDKPRNLAKSVTVR